MKKPIIAFIIVLFIPVLCIGDEFKIPHRFEAKQDAVAEEFNENFEAIERTIRELQEEKIQLQKTIESLQDRLNQGSGPRDSKLVKQEIENLNAAGGGWRRANLENGWLNYGDAYADASYIKDLSGFVHLRGLVKGPGTKAPVFVLEKEYRPQVQHEIVVACAGDRPCEVVIQTNGNVWFETSHPKWVSLDGLVFKAN